MFNWHPLEAIMTISRVLEAWAVRTNRRDSIHSERFAKRFLILACATVVFVLAGQARLLGQSTFGSILGTSTDQSGAAIPAVTVTLTNLSTQDQQRVQGDSNGNYQFLNLQPSTYSLDFEKAGFDHLKRTSITVAVQSAVRVDSVLQVGSVNQTIQVTTQAASIETQPGAISQLVEGEQVQQMPLNGRNPYNLLELSPGVIPQGSVVGNPLGNQAGGVYTNNTGFGNYQIGGGMANESAFYFDGAPMNTTYINSPGLVPVQDATQEFRVDTNAVSAEFGHFAGGVVNLASKGGSNQFHGTAYEYIRNKVLNANTFFNDRNHVPTPAFTQNQYGIGVGGPIRHDKIFGFFDWENFAFRTGDSIQSTVPTAAMMSGNFTALCPTYDANGNCTASNGTQLYDPLTTCGISGAPACPAGRTPGRLPFAYNMIPTGRLDSASKQYFTYYGPPNQAGTTTAAGLPLNNFATNISLGGNSRQFNGRIDWDPSEAQRIFARYSYWAGTSLPADPFHTHFGGLYSYTGSQNFVIGDTYTLSPHTVTDFRLSYLRATNGFSPEQLGTNLSLFGPAWASLASQITLDVAPLASNGFYGFNMVYNRAIVNNYFLSGSLIRILGRHTLKIGGEARRNEWNFAQTTTAAGTYTFDQGFTSQLSATGAQQAQTGYAGASYFLGNPASGTLGSVAFTDSIEWYLGAYIQDTFQVNRKLTITAGGRWEFPEAFTEHNNRLTVMLPHAVDPLSTQVNESLTGQLALVDTPAYPHRQLIDNRYDLFSPRVNLAYDLTPKVSVRSGYGISYIPPDMVNYSESPFQSPVNAATSTMVPSVGGTNEVYPAATFSNPFATGLIPPIGHNPSELSIFEGQSVISPIPNEHYGYAQQWDLDVQGQVTQSLMVEAGYAGSKGSHLSFSTLQLNQLADSDLAMGAALNTQETNPFYGFISSGLLSGKTVSQAQLLRPHPQFQGFSDTAAERGDSHWDALETRVVKRFHTGGVLTGSYTWGKLISNTETLTSWLENHGAAGVQDWNNLGGEKSLASFNVANRVVADYVLDLPFGTNHMLLSHVNPAVNRVVGGWSVNGITILQSGYPLAFTTSTNQTDSQGGGSRPNVVAGQAKAIGGAAQSRLSKWFNTAAFAAPPAFTFGNESRTDNSLKDDGVANWDLTLRKETAITEKVNFEFKTEVFNTFNRVQFADPGTSVGSASYGIVSSQLGNPRLIQFSGRFNF
jgi:Carboxypeptidase regulatory-like domain/TonB dependent receptor